MDKTQQEDTGKADCTPLSPGAGTVLGESAFQGCVKKTRQVRARGAKQQLAHAQVDQHAGHWPRQPETQRGRARTPPGEGGRCRSAAPAVAYSSLM